MSPEAKQVVVELQSEVEDHASFIQACIDRGVEWFVGDPKLKGQIEGAVKFIDPSLEADLMLVSDKVGVERAVEVGKPFAYLLKVERASDVKEALIAAECGAEVLVVETSDWRIIPLENLIAELQRRGTRIYAKIEHAKEVPTMFGILESGVDGVVLPTGSVEEVEEALSHISSLGRFPLKTAQVKEVREVGLGDRACVDTASLLNLGEGMLVGSRSSFLFLMHNESLGSEFTSARPFRVNAGAIHSYVLMPDGRTKYLSELESGDEVLVVDRSGEKRRVVVGRIKIERRPLKLVLAEAEGTEGGVLVQNAETIMFVGEEGRLVPATDIKEGDKVLVYSSPPSGRHFGVAVEEFVLER